MDKEIFEYKEDIFNECGHHRKVRWWSNYNTDSQGSILNESNGILNSFTQDLSRFLVRFIRNSICPILDVNDTTEPDTIISDIDNRPLFKRFVFYPPCSWLDELYIYVTTSFGNDSFVLCKNGNKNYDILYNGNYCPAYKTEGTHLKYMSIVFSSDLAHVNEYEISGIILHEMKHDYDLIRKNFMSDELNKDIKYFYDTLPPSNIHYITQYYNYNDNQIKDFAGNLNADEIYALLRDMIYYLNSSEISARLVNFIEYVYRSLSQKDYNNYGNTNISIYLGLDKILTGLIEHVSNSIKQEFSDKYLRHFSQVYSGSKITNDKPVVRFIHRGKFDDYSFNYLMNFFKRKIEKFMHNCEKIYKSITNTPDYIQNAQISFGNFLKRYL